MATKKKTNRVGLLSGESRKTWDWSTSKTGGDYLKEENPEVLYATSSLGAGSVTTTMLTAPTGKRIKILSFFIDTDGASIALLYIEKTSIGYLYQFPAGVVDRFSQTYDYQTAPVIPSGGTLKHGKAGATISTCSVFYIIEKSDSPGYFSN